MATETSQELEDVELHVIELEEAYEVGGGKVVEEPFLGVYEMRLCNRLARWINLFDPSEHFGEVVIEMLFILDQTPMLRRRPDVAFVSRERWPADRPVSREAAWDVVPDLAVEITSPPDVVGNLMNKIEEYFAAGVRLIWVIHPGQRRLYAYNSPVSVRILSDGEDLDGGAVIP